MQFDDRLATVLRMRTGSATLERTQFRQLLDLLGTATASDGTSAAGESAYAKLAELAGRIVPEQQGEILREPGLRLRNPQLVEFLAHGDPKPAASAMASARLSEREWETLIPRLPVTARGFLRHRRDLPEGALRALRQLGVGDLVLNDASASAAQPTEPAAAAALPTVSPPPVPARVPRDPNEPIGALIERIEQFRTARRAAPLAPRLPLGDAAPVETARVDRFEAATDPQGMVVWASPAVAPWLVGMQLTGAQPGPLARLNLASRAALRRRQPLHEAALTIGGETPISGGWRIDAAPDFTAGSGAFTGYRCRMMRALVAAEAAVSIDSQEDRMRQVLHELRTPVNAIQGFAEIIQQQLFGTVPHEYRSQAAAIAADAAKLLAGFEDLDRLARLESGALVPETGACDMREAVGDTLTRLDAVLQSRNARIALKVSGSPFNVDLDRSAAMALCWRLLASAAGALAADEVANLLLDGDGNRIKLELDLPLALSEQAAAARGTAQPRSAISAGLFGPQFAFRLASAEVRAAGGTMDFFTDKLALTLPVLTHQGFAHSTASDKPGA